MAARKQLFLSDALRTLDIYRWEGDETNDAMKKSNFLILRQSANPPLPANENEEEERDQGNKTKEAERDSSWEDVFNGQPIDSTSVNSREVVSEPPIDEIPEELLLAFDLERIRDTPQRGERVDELQCIDTDQLQDEICDALAVMSTEIQLRAEQEEEKDDETTATTITTPPPTTTTSTTSIVTTSEAKKQFDVPSSWADVDESIGQEVHQGFNQTYPTKKKTKSMFSKLKSFTAQWITRKHKKSESGEHQTNPMSKAIKDAKKISRETELLKSYDYGPQQFFFGKSTLDMSIRECFRGAFADYANYLIIEKVLNEKLVERFVQKWWEFKKQFGEDSSEARVRLVFHGTRRDNLESIRTTGLRIPAELPNVYQANGAVHGRGVYVSRNCLIASGYTGDYTILVCAAVLGRIARGSSQVLSGYNCNVVDWSSSGDCIVLYDSAQVLPLYVTTVPK